MSKSNSSIDISVVIAVRNEEKYLKEALCSVLGQRDCTIEVILINDNSTDSTLEIANQIAMTDDRLVVLNNPERGKCFAFNLGVEQSRGRYICLFAGDDIMPPNSLSARWMSVKDYSDSDAVIGLSKLITMSTIPRYDGHVVPRASGKGALSGVSPLMNRVAAQRIFPVPTSLPNEDSWMELAVLHLPNWVLVHTDIICCQYRVHENNSINFLVPFDEYNNKITARLRALPLFFEKHNAELDPHQRNLLVAKITCERHRINGSLLGVLMSSVGLVDKFRAVSILNSFTYQIRRTLFGLFSGW